MTETKVDSVLNFARNVFVDTALKVTSPLIIIVFIIFLFVLPAQDHLGYFKSKSLGIINASPTSKNLVHPSCWHKAWFGLYWISERLALSPHQTWISSQMHNFLSDARILKYLIHRFLKSLSPQILIRHGPPYKCGASAMAPSKDCTEGKFLKALNGSRHKFESCTSLNVFVQELCSKAGQMCQERGFELGKLSVWHNLATWVY